MSTLNARVNDFVAQRRVAANFLQGLSRHVADVFFPSFRPTVDPEGAMVEVLPPGAPKSGSHAS